VHENSALFSVEALDAREENVVNALVDVDEHFGPTSSPNDPYTGIKVVGTGLSPMLIEKLRENGYTRFDVDNDGFVAWLGK